MALAVIYGSMPEVVSINVNPRGGVPKHAVLSAQIQVAGVVGDKQNDRRYHGGPERAVCLYSMELIESLREDGHPISPGTTGENLTISGLDWPSLVPGVRLKIGAEVELEITSYAAPCKKISGSFCDGDSTRLSQKVIYGQSRLYTRVLREGAVKQGDAVVVLER